MIYWGIMHLKKCQTLQIKIKINLTEEEIAECLAIDACSSDRLANKVKNTFSFINSNQSNLLSNAYQYTSIQNKMENQMII